MNPLINWLLSIAHGVGGYLGIFVISILGNMLPFIPIPYLLAVYLYAMYIPGSNPIVVGIVSALGGGIGKLIIYLTGRESSRLILSDESRKRYERIGKLIGNYGALMVFPVSYTHLTLPTIYSV